MNSSKYHRTSTQTMAQMAEDHVKSKRRTLPWWLRPFLASWLDNLIELLTALSVRISTTKSLSSLTRLDEDAKTIVHYADNEMDLFSESMSQSPYLEDANLQARIGSMLVIYSELLTRYAHIHDVKLGHESE